MDLFLSALVFFLFLSKKGWAPNNKKKTSLLLLVRNVALFFSLSLYFFFAPMKRSRILLEHLLVFFLSARVFLRENKR